MKKIFIYLTLCLTLLISFMAIHIWITWKGFKVIQKDYNLSAHENVLKKKFILRKNNKILELDLLRLLPFMDIAVSPKDWIEEHQDSGYLVSRKKIRIANREEKTLEVLENLEFEIENINDCEEVQCYQRRIGFEDIPPALWRGLIGVEDERFLTHRGVDLKALLRAIWVDIKERRLAQGGSTITQQVARNLYLGLEKSFSRKWKEILLSIFMEYELSKEEILQIYLNEVFWGSLSNIRVKGVYAASVFYFGKKPVDLSPYEVSILIAMLKGPNFYHPLRNAERLKERANLLLNKLKEMQLVSKTSKEWNDGDWKNWQKMLKDAHDDKRLVAITNLLKRSESQIEFYEEYLLVSRLEEILAEVKLKPEMQNQEMAYKIFVEDLSCVYNQSDENSDGICPNFFSYYSKQERKEEAAFLNEAHQIGSLMKPIVYRAIISSGKNMSDKVSTTPLKIKLRTSVWEPKESRNADLSILEMSIKDALQKSRNIPLIRLSQEVGFPYLEEFLYPYVPKLIKPLSEFPAQLLGSLELTIIELGEMYSKFIKDECLDILTDKIDESTSPLLVLSFPSETTIASAASFEAKNHYFFGKTGTSNNSNDNWFVGFDGLHLFVIWIGNEKKEQEKSLDLSGAWYSYRGFERYVLYRGKTLEPIDCKVFSSLQVDE